MDLTDIFKVIFKLLYAKGVINSTEYENITETIQPYKTPADMVKTINDICKFVE